MRAGAVVSARAGAVRLARTLAHVVVAAALLSAPRAAAAQVAFDSPAGRVEILGLRRWTVAMLRDSLRRYAPGHEPHDNGDGILDHLGAETPMAAGAAHALLVRLNGGRELGRGRAAWSAWAARL